MVPAVRRLMASSSVGLWIDRRVDPGERVTLSSKALPLGELLEAVAQERGLGTAELGGLVYLGPKVYAEKLPALAADWRASATARLKRRGSREWPRLTTPGRLAGQIAADAGCQIENPEAIPHDLMTAGGFTEMVHGDQLTLLLLGFDLRWRPAEANDKALRVEPIDYAKLKSTRPPRARSSEGQGVATEQRFTLRVVEQPAGAVLRQLAEQLQLELEIESDAATLGAHRISFQVDQATLEELCGAIGAAAGVTINLEAERVLVRPVRNE